MRLFGFFKKKGEKSHEQVQIARQTTTQYFGNIDINNVEDYYDTTIEIEEGTVELDLNFETKSSSQSEVNRINKFIDNLHEINQQNKKFIRNDYQQEVSVTSDYLSFYLEELDENELTNIINLNSAVKSRELQLMEKLRLIRVGVYPQAPYFATFDYSIDIDGEPCNQLLVVNIKENGTLHHITWES